MDKNSYMRFRMTDAEKRIIQAAADKMGMTASDFARNQLLAAARFVIDYQLGKENEVLKAFSRNASQVVERVKARGELYSPSPSPEPLNDED